MSKVKAAMSMSLDGYVGPRFDDEWFTDFERLNAWTFNTAAWRERQGMDGGEHSAGSALVAEEFDDVGAYVKGRHMFDFGEEPWGESSRFGLWCSS